MSTIETKRTRLSEVNKQLAKLTKQPLYKLRQLDELSKKMMLKTLVSLESEKATLLNDITV